MLGELNSGIIETILGRNKMEHFDNYYDLASRTQRPIIWQSVHHRWAEPTLWQDQLDAVSRIFRDGYRAYGLTQTVPLVRHFNLQNAQLFDEFPNWKNIMFLRWRCVSRPSPTRHPREAARGPGHRAHDQLHRRWDIVQVEKVVKEENKRYEGKSVAEMAAMRNQDPVDALLDLSLDEGLLTTFQNANTGGDAQAMGEILRSPYVLVGTSDAGAHVLYGADFGYGTTLLGLWVRERGLMTLEEAVHKLTFHVASVYGLEGRGLIRPGTRRT